MRTTLLKIVALTGSLVYVSAQTANDYKITSLPGIDINTLNFDQYAGHIEINSKTDANLFFWMIEREIKTEPEKLLIWLNGGPGCSSMDGLFLENGPFRVNKNLSLSVNEGGWQNYATNIFLDQPVGTGFSFANTDSYTHDLNEVADNFMLFIDQLFTVFPHLSQQDMYIAGESFAGTYIPYFASRLIQQKDKYRLKGIAIGNGWVSSVHQYNAYFDFSMQHNLIPQDRVAYISSHLKTCQDDIKRKETIHVSSCEKILSDIVDASTHEDKNGDMRCMNMYDIRMKEERHPECGLSWPYELEDVTRYLRQVDVKRAVHADKQILGWKECTSLVSLELKDDNSKPAYYLLPDILKEVPVLLFSGEYDLICNNVGTEYLIGNMTWNGSRGFSKSTKKQQWKIDNKLAGYYMQERNLTYVLIKDGSHMVPYDRPIECLDMINRFMHVGNNEVKGKQSQVIGDSVTPSSPLATTNTMTFVDKTPDTTQRSTPTPSSNDQEGEQGTLHGYSGWGVATTMVIFLIAISACCCCWFRSSRKMSASAADEFGGAPQRQREDLKRPNMFVGWIQKLFERQKTRKFRLDNDETNELDELVVETPTLFEAEASDNEEEDRTALNKPNNQHFTLTDGEETDDDFEDFADFEHDEGLTKSKRK
ncbi:Pheromone-processing carboxypeptidase KEX1 [Choanephora cucurbitarum]|uniref:Pheromone-processing carboxypeptidase KEX1 n=1 Tax=Choanephora cucurbitarum TaxID=101091 RepID=A0A1C7N603_9FUNG|nr:Pheromone-processing carboxypeptidase KEX1 [Choanephora cucurbitarum]